MCSYFTDWVARKTFIAEQLSLGGCGGSYAEACLIISAVISGIAAEIWPGERIDRNRFVELWARYSSQISANKISIPLLMDTLEREGMHSEVQLLCSTHPQAFDRSSSLVISGLDVDLSEKEVVNLCGTLSLKKIRDHSYGSLFYKHVRSSFVHEYQIAKYASDRAMAKPGCGISYVNVIGYPNRRIHFEIQWLITLLQEVASNAEELFDSAPQSLPSCWWLNEA